MIIEFGSPDHRSLTLSYCALGPFHGLSDHKLFRQVFLGIAFLSTRRVGAPHVAGEAHLPGHNIIIYKIYLHRCQYKQTAQSHLSESFTRGTRAMLLTRRRVADDVRNNLLHDGALYPHVHQICDHIRHLRGAACPVCLMCLNSCVLLGHF